MTWDKTLPAGTEALANGDNRIREMKTDIETALQAQGSFPGADTANPKYKWTPERGNTAARPSTSLVTGQLYLNTQTKALERYNGATWDSMDILPDGSVDATKLAASVAGAGLAGGGGTVLSVNVDGSTIEINVDTLRVKAGGITANELAASVAGDGLAGGGGTALSVNVDASTIEINSDTLRVKDAGVTEAKLATAVVNKLGQNIGLVARASRASNGDLLNFTGQGRLNGICSGAGSNFSVQIILDGVSYGTYVMGVTNFIKFNVGNSTTMFQVDISGAGQLNELNLFFKTSVQIIVSLYIAGTAFVQYERQA